MPNLLAISVLMVVAALAITLWVNRNIFTTLSVVLLLVMVPPYVGCIMITETDPRGERLAFLMAAGSLCMALGGLAARWLLHHNPRKELVAFRARNVQCLFASPALFSLTLGSFIVLGFVVIIIFFYRAGIPLLSGEVFLAKMEAAKAGGYLSVRFMRLFLPLLTMMYYVGLQVKARSNKTLTGVAALFTMVAFVLFGYRSYILNYLLVPFALLLAYHKVSKRALFIFGAAAVGSAVGITASSYQESSFRSLWDLLSQRLFISVVAEGLHPIVYGLVPTVGFLHGRGFWMDVHAVLSRVGIGPPGLETFGQHLVGFELGQNPYGFQTGSTLVGEGYANFGYPGVVAVMLVFGFVVQYLHILTLRGPKDTFLVPLSVYLQLSLLIASGGSFVFTALDSIGTLTIFVGVFFCLYIFWSLPFGGPRFRRVIPTPGLGLRTPNPARLRFR